MLGHALLVVGDLKNIEQRITQSAFQIFREFPGGLSHLEHLVVAVQFCVILLAQKLKYRDVAFHFLKYPREALKRNVTHIQHHGDIVRIHDTL